jgi:hypothetical protein
MRNERPIGLILSRMTKSGAAILGYVVVGFIVAQSTNIAWAAIAGVAGAAVGWNSASWFRAWRQHDEWS